MQTLLSIILLLFSFNLFSKNIILHIEGDQNKEIIEGINLSLKKYNLNPVSEKLSKEIFKLKKKKYGKCSSYKCLEEISKTTRIDTIIIINILEEDNYYVIKSRFIDFLTNCVGNKTLFYNKKDNNFISFGKESTSYLLGYTYKKNFYLSKKAMNSKKTNSKNGYKTNSGAAKDTVTYEKTENLIEDNTKKRIFRKKRLGIGLSLLNSGGLGLNLNYFIDSILNIEATLGIYFSVGTTVHLVNKNSFSYFIGTFFFIEAESGCYDSRDFGFYIPQGVWYSGEDYYFSINAGVIYVDRIGFFPWGGVKLGYIF